MLFIAAFSRLVFIGIFTSLKTTRPNAQSCQQNHVIMSLLSGLLVMEALHLGSCHPRPNARDLR